MDRETNTQSRGDQVPQRFTTSARATTPLPELQPQWLEPANTRLTAFGQARQHRGAFSGLLVAGALFLGLALGSAGIGAVVMNAGNSSTTAASAAPLTTSNQAAPAAQVQTKVFSNSFTRLAPAVSQAITATTTPGTTKPDVRPQATITATLTQQQAEQAALAAAPGSTVDHTSLQNQNGVPVYDVDFTNGGGVQINGNTGAVITVEAAGADQGGHGGGRGGHGGRQADQSALLAQATVTQAEAEASALAASPGVTVDHTRLGQDNGTLYWDVDFTNGGGAKVDAKTGAIIATEAAGTDQGGPGKGSARGDN